ncbi:DUF975 family protein [Thomasclavelia saccharogumia]|uniref:DUF975 family protein n=1 Tax=Thomasclavelia saccharogumia TaxID=341225 RepID=UPI000479A675|nr:DUF975 family protein [Thomasclavelia saccharogumia]
MNIRDIKIKARSVLKDHNNIIFVFIFISVITTVIDYLGQTLNVTIPFISLLVSIIMLPFSHGNVVTALKAVNERGDEVTIENEGLTGFKRFKELFFTYFIQIAFLIVLVLLATLILFFIAKITIDENVFDNLGLLLTQSNLYTSDLTAVVEDPAFIEIAGALGGFITIEFAAILIIAVLYSLTFALTPYVLEKYKIYGAKAMSESARLMKRYKGTLFVLYLSYLGWFLLTIIITAIIQVFLPVTLVSDLLVAVIMVYLFSAEMQICLAVLFEEIDLEDKNII